MSGAQQNSRPDSDAVSPLHSLDPDSNLLTCAFGRKGGGKTYLNRVLYRSYPYAKLCIDVNGNADPGPDAVKVKAPLPDSMPRPSRDPDTGRMVYPNLHYVVDPGSRTYAEDLDAAVSMALHPMSQNTMVWCGEIGEFTTGNRTRPAMRRLLMQSRHFHTSALFDGPRPKDIDKLVISQADLVAVFDLPDPDDRVHVAKIIGYPPAAFRAECDEVFGRGDYWFLLWDGRVSKLYRMPPLPQGLA